MKPPITDVPNELVARATSGEAAAVEEVVRRLQGPVHAIASRMLLHRHDAEDATQESLIRIVTRLAQFRGEARFTTWAFRIAVRRILDYREQRAAAAPYTFEAFRADLADGLDEGAEERVEDAVLHQQIKLVCTRAMLHCLDGDHRIAFILGEILELPSPEAAEISAVPPATFRKRLSRARAELQAFLSRSCGAYEPSAPCACHRRQRRAVELGRVDPARLDAGAGRLVTLRTRVSEISEMRRLAAYFQSDPEIVSQRDFVAALRTMLGAFSDDPQETA